MFTYYCIFDSSHIVISMLIGDMVFQFTGSYIKLYVDVVVSMIC